MIKCGRGLRFRHRWSNWQDVGARGELFAKQYRACSRCGLVQTKYMDHHFIA